jgi:hypothetical protein
MAEEPSMPCMTLHRIMRRVRWITLQVTAALGRERGRLGSTGRYPEVV